MNRPAMQRFMSALETSGLRKDVYLHVCASVTAACILAAALFPWLRDVAETVIEIVALILLIRFVGRFHRVLGANRPPAPSKLLSKVIYWTVAYVGMISLLGALGSAASLIEPGFLPSQHNDMGITVDENVLMILAAVSATIAGPLEEVQRWALTFGLYFLGTRLSARLSPFFVFWLSLVASAALFGAEHLGNFLGHSFETVVLLGSAGLVLSLFAYWMGSLWAAALLHSFYNLLAIMLAYLDPAPLRFTSWGQVFAVQVLTMLGCALVLRRLSRQNPAGSSVSTSS
ncbi:MAG: CPBP family intramembrane metalloprotease [Clostridia bacterium]|nr:CPBP family intramembrane metalloprotease [Clostridia bacterium]